jgi:diacylglycerol kinase family enzyme
MTSGRGVVLVNPEAGGGGEGIAELTERFAPHGVERCAPDDLGQQVRTVLAPEGGASQPPAFVGVAGGDGSVRTAAEVLAGTGVPLLVVPTGTRNHFARAIGIDSIDAAGHALTDGTPHPVDVASVSGRVFVNNAVIGQYPDMVRRRRRHDHRLPKTLRSVLAFAGQLRDGDSIDVVVDGTHHRAWAVFVGNGRYGSALVGLTERASMDDGLLDVRVVGATGRLTRLRLVVALATGRLDRSPLMPTFAVRSVHVHLIAGGHRARGHPPTTVDVAVDGEVLRLSPPLELRCHPGALLVYRPPMPG